MLKIHSIKPMYTKLVVTSDRYENDSTSNGLVVNTAGSLKEYQKVIATGPMVKDIKVGDYVMINPARYIKKKYSDDSLRTEFVDNPTVDVNIPTVEMDGVPYFLIDTNDVDYIIESFTEEEDTKSSIIQPRSDIKAPKVIV